jgi:hypothetical protein
LEEGIDMLNVNSVYRLRGRVLIIAAGAAIAWAGSFDTARALQLCEQVADQTCREDVDAKLDAAIAALISGVPREADRRSAVAELRKAGTQFDLARLEILDADPSLTEEQVCSRAGNQDDRGLKQITRGVTAAEKIAASKFASTAAFNAARAALAALVQSVIDAVGDNADQVFALTGPLTELADAAKRLTAAQSNLDAGRLGKAADGGQRAYDVIRDQGNVATCLDNQE